MHVVAASCFAIKVFGHAINGVVASLGRWDNWFAPTWALILYHSCCVCVCVCVASCPGPIAAQFKIEQPLRANVLQQWNVKQVIG